MLVCNAVVYANERAYLVASNDGQTALWNNGGSHCCTDCGAHQVCTRESSRWKTQR